MQAILNFIVDILSQPAILVALIAFIGLIVQKKPAATITSGTIKTILGFLILSAGADVVVRSLEPFGKIFQHAFGVQGIVPNNEAIVSLALKDFGTTAALIMVCGMIVNILIARFTNLKYIFLTGHHTFYMAAFLAIILTVSHIKGWLTIVIGALVLGLISYFAAGAVGQLFKGKSKSTEEIKFPKGLSFLRESTISISITMALLYFIACLFAGVSYVHESISDGQNFIVFSLIQGVTFAAGVFIILTGVRLILAEIVPAFKGISEKLVPNSKPALDCPIVFPYAQNAVLIGFFVSFITGVIGMFILFLFGGVVILPGVVAHFFLGATAAVFGNARGGIKGAVAGAALNGILITFLPLLFLPFLGELGGAATTFSDTDFLAVGIVFGNAVKYMGLFGAILFIIIVGATAILLKGHQKPQQ
ncbi:TPA: PTS ascorbate transporter subunit IIC [Staphylococcus aureus]|nr:PTS ascorbate transporter subunit IIC [Staphylococcus aureus]HDT6952540.1 PTS ascorbate transporter subunit IIC [Staphylococcus aureus]HDT6957661.1 PTS ascorbate transporter subunit IIC [Staphylococcus aureus]HDT6963226.1 PTS ascorbate transporter subunit IIC [Staphylococcus aureus]HDT6973590.1 PTS ascorbate transporter subunit IIC [Staphylococcus aureus]